MKETKDVYKVYDKIADWFHQNRGQDLMEKAYLDFVLANIPQDGKILDLGCGTGKPILAYLLSLGRTVVAVDASKEILKLAAQNFPDQAFILQDMRDLDLPEKFDAIIAWHSFFHLPAIDQPLMFPIFKQYLNPGGILVFTSGPAAGEAWSRLNEEDVFHASLSPTDYEQLLQENKFIVLKKAFEDPTVGKASVWVCQKT